MSKQPDDRYQTAGDVAERLTDWLADRGQEVGDSGKRSDSGSGIGSGVFRRFADSISRNSGDSGSAVRQDGQDVLDSASLKPEKDPNFESKELELAPLDKEALEEDEGAISLGESSTDNLTSSIGDTLSDLPQKSLIEEAFEKQEAAEVVNQRFQKQPGEIDPLRPPGFSGPSYGPPVWVYVLIGVGALAVIGALIAVLSSGNS